MRFCQIMACGLLAIGLSTIAGATVFRYPTANTALTDGKPEDFYMYVDRDFEGVKSQPWEGGSYGFTRTLIRTQAGPVAIKFHEGIDIKPLRRDAAGDPLDDIHPVAGGRVVYVSDNPRHSNYGRYIVLEHPTPDGPIYSLYAHLAAVSCRKGDQVGTGNVIGRLGHSGVGLDRVRSHLHLELCLLLQQDFGTWYRSLNSGSPNYHDIFNGLNLAGFNPADALTACKDGNDFSLSAYITSLPPQYTVRVPAGPQDPDILRRYPFLRKPGPAKPQSWEITLTGTGIPISLTPSAEPCQSPTVIWAQPHPFSQLYRTVNRVSGSSKDPKLTESGKRYLRLLFGN